VATPTPADGFGGYQVHISVVESQPPIQHTFHARGETSGRTSNDAGIHV
jgi:hypothetical protein